MSSITDKMIPAIQSEIATTAGYKTEDIIVRGWPR